MHRRRGACMLLNVLDLASLHLARPGSRDCVWRDRKEDLRAGENLPQPATVAVHDIFREGEQRADTTAAYLVSDKRLAVKCRRIPDPRPPLLKAPADTPPQTRHAAPNERLKIHSKQQRCLRGAPLFTGIKT